MPLIMSAKGKRFMGMGAMGQSFASRATDITVAAATTATEVSRETYTSWLSGRPLAPPRNKRKTTSGEFPTLIKWNADGDGMVRFDFETLDEEAWYWKMQEIGTGKTAKILFPEGEITTRSQKNREFKPGLFWGDAGGIPAEFPGLQQLYPYTMAPPGAIIRGWANPENHPRIKREIKAKHFVRDGGKAGFAQFRDELRTEFRASFL